MSLGVPPDVAVSSGQPVPRPLPRLTSSKVVP